MPPSGVKHIWSADTLSDNLLTSTSYDSISVSLTLLCPHSASVLLEPLHAMLSCFVFFGWILTDLCCFLSSGRPDVLHHHQAGGRLVASAAGSWHEGPGGSEEDHH